MEAIMLGVKYALFYGMEAVVVAVVGITLVAGLYQLVRDKLIDLRTVSPKETFRPTAHK